MSKHSSIVPSVHVSWFNVRSGQSLSPIYLNVNLDLLSFWMSISICVCAYLDLSLSICPPLASPSIYKSLPRHRLVTPGVIRRVSLWLLHWWRTVIVRVQTWYTKYYNRVFCWMSVDHKANCSWYDYERLQSSVCEQCSQPCIGLITTVLRNKTWGMYIICTRTSLIALKESAGCLKFTTLYMQQLNEWKWDITSWELFTK